MCPLRGCGEVAAPPRPQFPHLSMVPLGFESVRFMVLTMQDQGHRMVPGEAWTSL